MTGITLEIIAQKLGSYSPKLIHDRKAKRAGVFVPLYTEDERISIILTKRTMEVSVHKGEVSFPGGTCEPGDSDTKEAALRECSEEIGVKVSDVKIFGRLDDTYTITGYLISPYVGTVFSPRNFRINEKEVASLIFLPVKCILHPDFQKETHSLIYDGEKIFGATFRILKNLSTVLLSA